MSRITASTPLQGSGMIVPSTQRQPRVSKPGLTRDGVSRDSVTRDSVTRDGVTGLRAGKSIIGLLALAHLVSDAVAGMLSPLLPNLQSRFQLSQTTLALLVATLALSASVAQPLMGALADRFGRRRLGVLGLMVASTLVSLVAVAPAVWLLFVLLLVGGLGSAAFHPAGTAMARAADTEKSDLAVSLFSAAGTLGIGLSPIIVLTVISSFGAGAAPWLMTPGITLGLLMLWLFPTEEDHRSEQSGKQPLRIFDAQLFTGPVGLLCLVSIFANLAWITFYNTAPLWLVSEHEVPRAAPLLGWMLSVFAVSPAVGGLVAGALSRRYPRRWLVAAPMLLALAPLLVMLRLEPGTPSFFAAVAVAGFLVNAGLPLLIVSAQDLSPGAEGAATGIMMGFTMGVAGVLYIGIGWLQDILGLVQAMSAGYLFLIPGAALAFWVLSRHRPANADTQQPRLLRCLCSACLCGNAYAHLDMQHNA